MARRESTPDAKETSLAAARCLNPHPEQVRDAEFLSAGRAARGVTGPGPRS